MNGLGTTVSVAGQYPAQRARAVKGFTLLEGMVSIFVMGVLVGVGIPLVQNALKPYHLAAAVAGVTGVVESTRYQAVMYGCSYALALSQTTTSYQISYEALSGSPPACAGTFSNVGGAVPWSSSGDVSLSASTTLQFSPNGIVTATTGSTTFSLTNGTQTEQITVSGVGDVTASP